MICEALGRRYDGWRGLSKAREAEKKNVRMIF